jgi:hypothetical protein
MSARELFENLEQIVQNEVQSVQQVGATALGAGNTTQALQSIERIQVLQSLTEDLQQLRERWKQVLPDKPQINKVAETQTNLPVKASPVLHLPAPAPEGATIPIHAYHVPVLYVLNEMGGSAAAGAVIERIGQLFIGILNDLDKQNIPGHNEALWSNRTRWARKNLIDLGYLKNHAPRGTWEITQAGRDFLHLQAAQQVGLFKD